MTAEAKEWIESLDVDPRQPIYEIEHGMDGLTKIVLDGKIITQEEWAKAVYFAKNGDVRISVESR